MADEEQIIHDFSRFSRKSRCYLYLTGGGAVAGSLVKPGLGTLIGAAAGLLVAAYSCDRIVGNSADPFRFLSEA